MTKFTNGKTTFETSHDNARSKGAVFSQGLDPRGVRYYSHEDLKDLQTTVNEVLEELAAPVIDVHLSVDVLLTPGNLSILKEALNNANHI